MKILELHSLTYSYDKNKKILKSINAQMETGKMYAILGPSGCGKTTLLKVLGLIDKPTSGKIFFTGKDASELWSDELADIRRREIGFVFQDFSLLDSLSVEDNILLPCVLSEKNIKEKKDYMNELCTLLHIDGLQKRFPYELSGGQQQRVAIARALINQPEILLADEPSGALDSKSSMQLLEQFCELQKKGQSILMVTHSPMAASYGDRVVFLKDGKIVNEIYKGEDSRQEFYNRLVHMLSVVESRVSA